MFPIRVLLSLAVTICATISSVPAQAAPVEFRSEGLFENRFFTLSSDSSLSCSKSTEGALPLTLITQTLKYYESKNPELRAKAVQALLGSIIDRAHLAQIESHKKVCSEKSLDQLCVLTREWGNAEVAGRVLALFYDTGVLVQRENPVDGKNFSDDQVKLIEKAIRKIPVHLRAVMHRQEADMWSAASVGKKTPMVVAPMSGDSIGSVFIGSNQIFLQTQNIEAAKDGAKYKNLNLAFLVDFRLQMVVHEMGHVVDNMLTYTTRDKTCAYFQCRRQSDSLKIILNRNRAAEWPNRWWSAFTNLSEIQNERYEANDVERFAEFFAQYILMPIKLKAEAPEVYEALKAQVFRGVEYQGYETCSTVRELKWHEKALAPRLN